MLIVGLSVSGLAQGTGSGKSSALDKSAIASLKSPATLNTVNGMLSKIGAHSLKGRFRPKESAPNITTR